MKLLLLTTFPIKEKELTLKNVKNQYEIFTFFVHKYFSEKEDVEVLVHQCSPKGTSSRIKQLVLKDEFPEADHCIVVDNRGLVSRLDLFYERLRPKIKKCIATISANNGKIGNEDILYYLIPMHKKNKPHCKLIYWSCPDYLCYPNQDPNKLRILIDHNYYGKYQRMVDQDKTEIITDDVCEFVRNYKNKPVVVRRFIRGGVETVDPYNISKLEKYKQGSGLCFEDACDEYSRTDIFIVTHEECMGLVVLETAMSGALIVVPVGTIKPELLQLIRHVEYDGKKIPWDKVLRELNHKESRKVASKYSWKNAIDRMHETLVNFDLYKNNGFRFNNRHTYRPSRKNHLAHLKKRKLQILNNSNNDED